MKTPVAETSAPEQKRLAETGWQRWLGRRLVLMFIIKIGLLTLLWYGFFSAERRPPTGAEPLTIRFMSASPSAAATTPNTRNQENPHHD